MCLSEKGPHPEPVHCHHADRRSFAHQRDAENRAIAADFLACAICIFGISQNVGDMNDFAVKQDAPGYRPTVDSGRVMFYEFGVFTRDSVARFEVVSFTLRSTYDYRVRLAQPGGPLDKRVEHCLEIEGRAADHVEHVGGGGLLLQRFAQLVEQPRVLDGDDGLVGEGCQKSDVILLERSHLGPANYDSAERTTFPYQGHAEGGPMSIL